ncbi:MAG: NAD-dependent DNA ligase LigA [Patescibacteria group bacterium]
MDKKTRYLTLLYEINRIREQFNTFGVQDISEEVLDSLKHELEILKKENPEFERLGSTDFVAGKVLDEFKKFPHKIRMTSLSDVFTFEEISDWEERNRNFLEKNFFTLLDLRSAASQEGNFEYCAELKMDGLSMSVIYENGNLVRAVTRGDGFIGEDVTENARTIKNLPKIILHPKYKNFEVRGEVVILKQDFEEINLEQEKLGLKKFANPRNLATGSLKQLDSKITEKRKLSFFAWDLIFDEKILTHSEKHKILFEIGFPSTKVSVCKNLEEVWKVFEEFAKIRENFEFWCDGIVVQINDLEIFDALGIVGKGPRGACAIKFPAEKVATLLQSVSWQVGRTGVLTPVAELSPVLLAGTIVKRASLHSIDNIKKLDVKVGDTVVVHKSGDIIPEIIEVLKNFRTGEEKEVEIPKICPNCSFPTFTKEDGILLFCTNSDCSSQKIGTLINFASKNGFDFENLGDKLIEKFYFEGLISDFTDFWKISESDLLKFEGFKETLAKKIVENIHSRKRILIHKFLNSLGIRSLGEKSSTDLANFINQKFAPKNFHEFFEILFSFTIENFDEIDGIAKKTAENFYFWFSNSKNQNLILELFSLGVEVEIQNIKFKNQNVNGVEISNKNFVITGSFEVSREKIKEKILEFGGVVQSVVSKSTNFLIVGDDAGSKLKKAKELGIEILEKDFVEKLFESL